MGQFTAVDISFASDGGRRAGRIYRPDAPHPVPCVVMCSGFGSTMDRLYTWAEVFAAAGLAALVFDYGSFGRSEGDPRQVVDIDGQLADVRSAVACARADSAVDADHVILWGNSLGGAHAITVAADDPRIAAVVAQIPFNGFPRRVEGRSTAQSLRLMAAILWDALRGRAGLTPHYIPLVGEPGEIAITNAPAAKEHVRTLSGGDSLWRNRVAPRATLRMMRYRPADAAARLTVPLLVCLATDDAETPVELSGQLAERAPYGQVKLYPGTHFSFYTQPQTRRTVASDQVAFIREALPPQSGPHVRAG
ncbi:alpha/beta hydrolase [Plantactinospora sp. GCM10030261]|uniref:alpha/beta hydrolase n=1 Tax=Plantactinospora sp. GCM10030261 TaxID=3273420 RepID=UPI00361A26E9